MNGDNKDFFEQLAGIRSDSMGGESAPLEADLVRANKVAPVDEDEEEALVETNKGAGDTEFDDAEGHLTVDVYQTAENIVIESTIAGVGPDDIDVAITAESVIIKGKRERKERVRKSDFLHEECFWGKFSRSIILPQEIDPDNAQASLKNGVLKIVLPKIHRSQGKKIKVKLD